MIPTRSRPPSSPGSSEATGGAVCGRVPGRRVLAGLVGQAPEPHRGPAMSAEFIVVQPNPIVVTMEVGQTAEVHLYPSVDEAGVGMQIALGGNWTQLTFLDVVQVVVRIGASAHPDSGRVAPAPTSPRLARARACATPRSTTTVPTPNCRWPSESRSTSRQAPTASSVRASVCCRRPLPGTVASEP